MSLGKEELLRKLISTPEGRRKIAASMVQPGRVPRCPDCRMPKSEYTDGHPWEECTVYRVMES